MKLTDLDAEFIAWCIREDVLRYCDIEPTETVHGVHRYDTKVGSFFVPSNSHCRENKALDALYKIATHLGKSLLETAYILADHRDYIDEQ